MPQPRSREGGVWRRALKPPETCLITTLEPLSIPSSIAIPAHNVVDSALLPLLCGRVVHF